MAFSLDEIVQALDELFQLDTAKPDEAMSRHLPRVYEEAGVHWRAFVEPEYAHRFNGLMCRGFGEVGQVYGACFPSEEVLDSWLTLAKRGDVLITHHPIDMRNGSPEHDVWAHGFVPISAKHRDAIRRQGLSIYACHAPMDTSPHVGTTASMVEALGGVVVDKFWPYGNGYAGLIADIASVSSSELVSWAHKTFGLTTVEVKGTMRDAITRIAVVAGVGGNAETMSEVENKGAQAFLTGELHVRIEGERGRTNFAQVQAFAATTGMTLIGVSHAASEHLVIETQLRHWFSQRFPLTIQPIGEHRWWR